MFLAGQEIPQKVRCEQDLIRPVKYLGPFPDKGEKLERRIKLHKLQPGDAVKFLSVNQFKALFDKPYGSGIPVMNRIFKKPSVLIKHTKIHAPGIDTDAAKAAGMFCLYHALLHLKKQAQRVPVHRIADDHRIVGKTMYLL